MSHSTFPEPISDHLEGASAVAGAGLLRLTLLRIEERFFGIPIESVAEVVVPRRIIRMPGASLPILGLANVRGSIVSVVDLSHALELDGDVTDDPRLIVLDHAGAAVALLVPEVTGIYDAELLPADEAGPRAGLIGGSFETEGRTGELLNLDRLLDRYFR